MHFSIINSVAKPSPKNTSKGFSMLHVWWENDPLEVKSLTKVMLSVF